jgi:hypothetical protein
MKKEGCGRELQKMRRQNESHKGGAVRRANRQIPEMQEVRPHIQDRRGISVLACARFFSFSVLHIGNTLPKTLVKIPDLL